MKTTFISKENNQVKFSMDFTAEEFDNAVVHAYKQSKNQFTVDGFRRGKASRSVIEKRYGEGIFFEDAINELFREGYPKAIDELDIEVIDQPQADFGEIGHGKPFSVTLEVPVYPVVEVKDYKGVEVDQTDVKIKDEDVDKEIDKLRRRNARMVVAERPVQDDDTVILDYAGFVGDEQFEGGTAENQELKIGSGTFIPGFEEQLKGVKAGDKVDVKVTFPEEYHAKDLAGKEAVFHCTVHEVKEEQLPELDDEFAKDVSEYDTVQELKDATRERLQETASMQAVNEAKDKLIEKVFEANKTDAPLSMVEDEISNMIRDLENQIRYQGLSVDQYLQFSGKDMDSFRIDMRPEAAKRVATRIVLRSIGNAEKIEVTEDDIDKELDRMAEVYQQDKEKIKASLGEDGLTYFRKDIALTKVMNMLYDEAKINMISEEEAAAKMAAELAKNDAKVEEASKKAEEGEDR